MDDLKLLKATASIGIAIALPFFVLGVRKALGDASRARRNERRFLAASHSILDAFFILESVRDDSGTIVDFRFDFVNAAGAALLSATPESLRGKLLCECYPVSRTDGFFEKYKRVVETGEQLDEEFRIDAEVIDANWLSYKVVKLDDGVAITTRKLNTRKENERKLAEMTAFSGSVMMSSPSATLVTDLQGTITSLNPAAERMFGYRAEELVAREKALIFLDRREVEQRAAKLTADLRTAIEPGIGVLKANPERGFVDEAAWKLVRHDGSRFDAQLTVSALTAPEGQIAGLILIAEDVTERKRTAEYISHLEHHDALTGLPTRVLFKDRLERALEHARRHQTNVGLLVVDVDNFKRVNDLMGQQVGDDLLIHIARCLQASVRRSDTVARMGGDEFVVIVDDLRDIGEAEQIAEQVLRLLKAPISLGTQTLSPTVSIGVGFYPETGDNAESLLKNADAAMHKSKAEGRNGYKTFTDDMASASLRKRQLETGLEAALALEEFELFYQPQISMRTGRVTGVEALLRWKSAKLGLVMPNDFIPLIEESGLIVPIGEWVLRTACRQGKQLQEAMGRELTVAVNISPRQLQQSNLPQIIRETLAENDFDAASLELEITENILVSDSPRAMVTLEEVRSLDVRVAIDDFGTGFCSMSYIMRFPVDRLKIDQSFIRGMTIDSNSTAVTRAVIALASGLNITVVAEGVETAAHRDLLIGMGCDEAQGYYYAKPVPFERLAAVILAVENASAQAPVARGLAGVPPPNGAAPSASIREAI